MGPIRQFFADLGASLGVIVRQPALPILSAILLAGSILVLDLAESGLGCLEEAGGTCHAWSLALYFVVGLPLAIYSIGWYGTERIWFLRAFRGHAFPAAEALRLTPRFIGPFFRLGLLALLVLAPIFLWATAIDDPAWILIPTFVVSDFLLTFVTPALAYSTRRAWGALRIGVRLISERWPASSLYILLPPLAAQASAALLEPVETPIGMAATMTLAVWLSLWMKGGVARFYLRHREPADPAWGAALLTKEPPVPRRVGES